MVSRVISVISHFLLLLLGSVICLSLTLATGNRAPRESAGTAIFVLVVIVLWLLVAISEVVAVFLISDSTHHTVLMSLFALIYTAFSPDALYLYNSLGFEVSLRVSEIICEVAFLAMVVSVLHMMTFTFRPAGKRAPIMPAIMAAMASMALYAVLMINNLQIIAHGLFLLMVLAFFVVFEIRCFKTKTDNLVFHLCGAVLFCTLGMETVNVLYFSGFVYDARGWSAGYSALMVACFLMVYLYFVFGRDQQAQKATALKEELDKLKAMTLIEQFKPHFVSNALVVIKSGYHENIDQGDEALWLFSKYMRETISMLNEGLVPFQRELEFVMEYVDFCSVGGKSQYNVVYDIDFDDYEVPPLSLQPYIENAVKYSKINLKEDGAITISSYLEKDKILLRISDNGVGFDVKEQKKGSVGLENSKKRFEILLQAKTTVKSSKEGTNITIEIPYLKGEEA